MPVDAVADNVTYKIGGFTVDRAVVRYIRDASEYSGISFDYMMAKAGHESRFDIDASAERSSAEGLYQFTAETWLQQMKLHGAKYGYASLASKIYRDSRGRYRVTDPDSRKTILDLRRSPRISALLAAEYAKSNKKILQDQVRLDVTPADLYIAHFMGPTGAVILLRADKFTPNKLAADLFPDAALANPPIFFDRKKRMRTVREVRKELTDIFEDKIKRFTALPKPLKKWLTDNPPEQTFLLAKDKTKGGVRDPFADGENAVPTPRLLEKNSFAHILQGEGVNLDDEKVMAAYLKPSLRLSESSGVSDAVSADFMPQRRVSYALDGIAAIEADSVAPSRPVYTQEAVTAVETDDYLAAVPAPYAVTVVSTGAEDHAG